MKEKTKWRIHTDAILKEMHERVGAKFEPKNVYEEENRGWFTKHTWTEKEQDDFAAWLKGYMKKHSDARRALMSHNINTDYYLSRFVDRFILDYGWRLKPVVYPTIPQAMEMIGLNPEHIGYKKKRRNKK